MTISMIAAMDSLLIVPSLLSLDARPGLNPFTFQSYEAPVEQPETTSSSIVPSLTSETATTGTPKAPGAPASASVKTKAATFPDQHLPSLLQAIEGSTAIRPVLVDELKGKFAPLGKMITKANIEACLNVYTEKLSKKMGAKWVVREEHRSIAGLEKVQA
jgi:chromatin assembly factor 1 subunit A